jgi:hypothetical protein
VRFHECVKERDRAWRKRRSISLEYGVSPPPRNTPYSPKYRFCYYVLPRVGHPPPFFLFFFFFEFLTQQIASFFRPKNWGIEIFEIFLPIANSTFFLFFFFECPIMLNLTILGP